MSLKSVIAIFDIRHTLGDMTLFWVKVRFFVDFWILDSIRLGQNSNIKNRYDTFEVNIIKIDVEKELCQYFEKCES